MIKMPTKPSTQPSKKPNAPAADQVKQAANQMKQAESTAKSLAETPEKTPDEQSTPIESIAESIAAEPVNESTLQTIDAVNRSSYQMIAELNKEVGEFVAKRWKENLAVPGELLKCQSPQDLFNVYSGYCQRTIQQYTDESQTITALGKNLLSETAKSIQENAEYDSQRNH
jgi:Mg2+ and Co2+ transporter CorA